MQLQNKRLGVRPNQPLKERSSVHIFSHMEQKTISTTIVASNELTHVSADTHC